MAKRVNLVSYWMPILRGIKEFQEIARTERAELELLLDAIDRALSNMFIETADEYGIERFEKMMGISPEDGATLEERRFNIQVNWNEEIPYTESALARLLSVLCGEDGYTVHVDYSNYLLTVKLTVTSKGNVEEVEKLLERVVPANMVTVVSVFNTHLLLSGFTHSQLSAYTYEQLRNGDVK